MNKKFIFVWMLVSLLLVGCRHGSDDPSLPPDPDPKPEPEPNPDDPDNPDPDHPDPEPTLVPIELYTGLLSRAAIDKFDGTPVGIAMGSSSEEIDEQWEATASGQKLSLSSVYYYPTDSSAVYLWGFYPRTTLSGSKADYRLSGKEDILYAKMQSGSLSAPFTDKEKQITFRHLLAQLQISVETGKEFQGKYRLKHLALKGSSTNVTLNLLEGDVEFGGAPMQVIVYTASESPGIEIEAGCDLPLGHILVQPGAELVMDIVLAKDGDAEHDIILEDIDVKFEGGEAESGLSYELPVRLPDKLEPDNPDNPDEPDNPDNPDNPDEPDEPDNPPQPEDPDSPRQELKLYATITAWKETPSGNITIE